MLNKIKKTLIIGLMFMQYSTHADNQENITAQAAKEAYEFGKMSIQSKDWRNAIESFQTAANNITMKEAALYWQAYSHYQIKQKAQAKRLLERLIENYPNSQWVDDAQMLLFENGDGAEQGTHQQALDEELKLFTLQQIMFNNPEKALPKVYEMLEQSSSERVKQNAIQLLGLSESEQVVDYLFRYIEKESNQGLQHHAIQMLSLRDSKSSRAKLKKLYDNSEDRDLKSAIIQGFIHHDDNNELIAMLKQEKDPELSMHLIQMLGIKGESAALRDRYKSAKGDQRRAILEALALSGDAAYLYDVIDNETDQEIRNQAIHSLIMVDGDNMGEYLAKLYEKAKNESEKDVISSVFIATDVDPDVIVRIFKTESNLGRKHQLLHTLMAMGEVQALQDLYRQEKDLKMKSEIIRQFGMMNATDVLMDLYKADPGLVNDESFFEAFGMSSSASSASIQDFLMAQFKAGNQQVKQGVLLALLIQDNVAALKNLYQLESNIEIKSDIIRQFGMMDATEVLMDLYKNDPSLVNDSSFFEAIGMSSKPVDEDFLMARFKAGNQQVKNGVLQALMMHRNVQVLKKLYQQESNMVTKSEIIRQFGMLDATEVLMDLYKKDASLINYPAFFEAIGMSSKPVDEDFLMARFKEGDEQVKQGVLQALMMQDNSDVLVMLLKVEKDHEVKKQIIKMIGITNPDALIDAIED